MNDSTSRSGCNSHDKTMPCADECVEVFIKENDGNGGSDSSIGTSIVTRVTNNGQQEVTSPAPTRTSQVETKPVLERSRTSNLTDDEESYASPRNCSECNESRSTTKLVYQEDATDGISQKHSRKVVCKLWTQWTEKLHHVVDRFVVTLALTAARYPKRTIASVIALSLTLLVVGFFTNFHIKVEETEIYAPFDSVARKHFDWTRDESGFSTSTRATLLVLHNHGENVLSTDAMRKVFEALDTVRNTAGYKEICDDGAYWDTRAKEYTCRIVSATRAWYNDVNLFEEQVASEENMIQSLSLSEYPGGAPFDHEYVMGNIVRDDVVLSDGTTKNNGTITHVPVFLVYFLISDKGDETKLLEEAIATNLLELQAQWRLGEEQILDLDFFTERSFSDEFLRAIEEDMYLIPLVFLVMSAFTCLVFFNRDRAQSRCTVGVGSVATIAMSLCSGFGLMFICGVPFTSMTQLLPFLVFGVGLDDTFIITGAFLRTDQTFPIEERIRHTMEDIGSSITVTTITTTLAFLLGLMSTVPAIFWLCLYASLTIMIDFIYQITFFVAILVLDERRLQAQRISGRMCCLTRSISSPGDEEIQASARVNPIKITNNHFADRAMKWYAEQLMRPIVKAMVLLIFVGAFGYCTYRASLLTQKLEVLELFPEGSFVTSAMENLYANQDRNFPVEIIFRGVNQSSPIIQKEMKDFISDIVELPAFGQEPPICWVRDFEIMKDAALFETISDLPHGQQVQYALSIPAIQEAYGDDIVVDKEGNIGASRCIVLAKNSVLQDVEQQISLLAQQRAITNAQTINQGRHDEAFFTFGSMYMMWEFYSVAVNELILSTLTSVAAVSIVALAFIPHWSALFFLVPMISIVYTDLLGVMQLTGLYISAVTYVCLVISVGLIVDFLLHIVLRYVETTRGSKEDRVKQTLETMGASILLGGLSTLLGILPLAFSTSAVMRTIFTGLCAMLVLAISHGLILLPVLLSMVGPLPGSNTSSTTGESVGEMHSSTDSDSDFWESSKCMHSDSVSDLHLKASF